MTEFIEFLANNELTIVIGLMVLIFILVLCIIFIDLKAKKEAKEELNDQEDNLHHEVYYPSNIEDTGELGISANQKILEEIDVDKVTKNLEKTAEIDEIKYVEENEELEKTKAQIELQTLKEELAKIEQEDLIGNNDLHENSPVMEEPKELKKKEENNNITEASPVNVVDTPSVSVEPTHDDRMSMEEEVDQFESDQEENAIISVSELEEKKQIITDEEIAKYEDDGNEPISIKELEDLYKSIDNINEEVPTLQEKVNLYEDKEFKTTPVISPVYGYASSNIELENTANLDKLNEELKKTNEFLNALKELRKNLE